MRALVMAMALTAAINVHAGPKLAPVPGFDAPVMTTQVDGMIEIDGKGKVSNYTIEKGRKALTPAVAERLNKQVRGWSFEPIQVDGQPVIARARMRVTLLAQERPDGFVVSVDNVTFPPLRDAVVPDAKPEARLRMLKTSRIRYPDEFEQRGLDATVLVSFKLNADGGFADAAIVQTSIPDRVGKPEEFGRLAAILEAEVMRAVPRFKFAVDYPAGAEPETQTGMLPIVFLMEGQPKDQPRGLWRTETRSIKRTPAWLTPVEGQRLAGVSDLNDGETATANGGLRLKQTVNGAVL